MEDVKTCRKCGETKLLSEFGKSGKTNGSGYKAVCKVCLAKKLSDWRKANPEKAKEQDRRFYNNNKEKISIKNKKRYVGLTLDQKFTQLVNTACKRKNFKCFVDVEDLHNLWQQQNGLCAYTKLPLTSEAHQLNTVSLDRIDSNKDYIVGNIQLVCVPVNRMKLDMTEQQFVEFCQLVAQHRK
jgi:hypothetical protein